jgi:hypothetical protein
MQNISFGKEKFFTLMNYILCYEQNLGLLINFVFFGSDWKKFLKLWSSLPTELRLHGFLRFFLKNIKKNYQIWFANIDIRSCRRLQISWLNLKAVITNSGEEIRSWFVLFYLDKLIQWACWRYSIMIRADSLWWWSCS